MTRKKTVGQQRILIKTCGGRGTRTVRSRVYVYSLCIRFRLYTRMLGTHECSEWLEYPAEFFLKIEREEASVSPLTESAVEGEGMPVVSPRPRAQITGGESVGGNTLLW